jgi:hypothetical protein
MFLIARVSEKKKKKGKPALIKLEFAQNEIRGVKINMRSESVQIYQFPWFYCIKTGLVENKSQVMLNRILCLQLIFKDFNSIYKKIPISV